MAAYIQVRRALCILAALTAYINYCEGARFASWSFDKHFGTTIIPEFPSSTNFLADASGLGTNPSDIFPPGKNGDCLFVDGKELILAKNLNESCIFNLDLCKSGLTISFYLKVVSWNNASEPVILKTSSGSEASTRLYIGRTDDNRLPFRLVGSNSQAASASASIVILNRWARYQYVLYPSPSHGDHEPQIKAENTDQNHRNFIVGSENGASFYLDDLVVDYAIPNPQTPGTVVPTTNQAYENSITTNVSAGLSTAARQDVMPTKAGYSTTPSSMDGFEQFYVWILIVFGILTFTAGLCIIFVLCFRRQRRQRRDTNFKNPNEITIEFSSRRNGSCVRTSTIE